MYEVVLFNDHIGHVLRGEQPFDWPEYDEEPAPEARTQKAAISAFRISSERIIATVEAMSAEDLEAPVPTEKGMEPYNITWAYSGEATRFGRCQFMTTHTWYHDGQLNLIQAQLGDGHCHWVFNTGMKELVKHTLQPLIGEPLSDMWRFAGIQCVEIGEQRPTKNREGQDITQADQTLHISCRWSLHGPEGPIVSSEDFDDGEDGERRDTQAYPFYDLLENNPPAVEALEADNAGGLRLTLAGGYSLIVQPDTPMSELEEAEEQWRYLPKDKDQRHLVITQFGVQAYSIEA